MVRKVDTLPDFDQITGQLDHNGNPILRSEISDAPNPARMQEMRDKLIQRINELPQTPRKSVVTIDANGVKHPALRGLHHPVKGWP